MTASNVTAEIDYPALAVGIRELFSPGALLQVATGPIAEGPLFPEEAVAVCAAVEPRQREFAAGRKYARAALRQLGGPAQAIPVGPRREPLWPAAFVGSISHCAELCCAVAARRSGFLSVGVDVEQAGRLERMGAEYVCTAQERARFLALPAPLNSNWPTIAFSAKEAVLKCCYPLLGAILEFHDLQIDFAVSDSRSHGQFAAQLRRDVLPAPLIGRWMRWGSWVFAGAAIPAPPP